ncbi:MAG TPA: hypothetical protein VD948_05725 [Rhodothermales bacterium]|nr:hypothetical protein [Rhodothermales bacterium]
MDEGLSSGIVCFEIEGLASSDAKERLLERHVVASVAPYPSAYPRFTPSVINTPEDVEVAALRAVRALE